MKIALWCWLVMVVGCVTSPDHDPVDADMPVDAMPVPSMDPTGRWTMTLRWGAGTCGFTRAVGSTVVIAHDSGGYVIADADPRVTVTGTLLCSPSSCHASLTEVGPGVGAMTKSATISVDLDLTREGALSGSGGIVYQFTDGQSCSQQFNASGQRA